MEADAVDWWEGYPALIRFLHAADIHLDSPLRGLQRYEGAPVEAIRRSTRRAFENLVQLALEEKVDFVLIAGDLYDGDWDDYNTGLFFCAQTSKLSNEGIPVLLIAGNHDAQSKMTRRLSLPKNVHLLPSETPGTHLLEKVGVAVHGQSFATAAVEANLALQYPAALRGYFNIGMLHTSATGREGHAPYAPCTCDDLLSKGYDYWALGHVHTRELLHADPPILFPGNLQGRHVRETGPKGCTLVTVDDRGHVQLEERYLDVLRWDHWYLDASSITSGVELLDHFADMVGRQVAGPGSKLHAVRIEVVGVTPAHSTLLAQAEHWEQQIRARATEESGGMLWIEKVLFKTHGLRDAEEIPGGGPIGELLELLQGIESDDEQLRELAGSLDELSSRLPREMKDRELGFDLLGPDRLQETLGEVREMLLQGLLHPKEVS